MLHAVIMAGGSGTRFWPASRTDRPKQLLPITGGLPMLAETVARLDGLVPTERVWVVTNARQVEGVLAACPALKRENVLVEPCARNTAPCVGLAAAVVHARDSQAVMAVLSADHLITPVEEFQRSLRAGAEAASQPGTFVTFGIPPSYPATGYGYIKRGELRSQPEGLSCYEAKHFEEKPKRERAEEFLSAGTYLWNSGIFVWRTDTILAAMKQHMPNLLAGLEQIVATLDSDRFQSTVDELYPEFESVPIDIGIMEKVDGVQVLSAPYKWSDVGSWRALYDELPHDDQGHATVLPEGSELLTHDASGVLAYATEPQVIAVLGLKDVLVVQTGDAILVADRERSEEVKLFVKQLEARKRNDVL